MALYQATADFGTDTGYWLIIRWHATVAENIETLALYYNEQWECYCVPGCVQSTTTPYWRPDAITQPWTIRCGYYGQVASGTVTGSQQVDRF